MKHFLIWFLMSTGLFAQGFDDRNVWHPVDGNSQIAGQVKSITPIRDVSDMKEELNVLIYGTTPGDSLKIWFRLYGMMSGQLADTLHAVLILEDSGATTGNTFVYADTLEGTERFPYLFARLANNHADSTAVLDMYIYMIPQETTILRR